MVKPQALSNHPALRCSVTTMTQAWETTPLTTGSLTVSTPHVRKVNKTHRSGSSRGLIANILFSSQTIQRLLRKGLTWSRSQNFIPRACATVHQPRWQFWDKFINRCCRRLSYSGISPSRYFLIKADQRRQKTLCCRERVSASVSSASFYIISTTVGCCRFCLTVKFGLVLWTQFVWAMFKAYHIFLHILFTDLLWKASKHSHSQKM